MKANHKRLKTQERVEEPGDLDRLSELPDCILLYILSFLDTVTSVRTSSLSQRYRPLWSSCRNLYFEFPLFRSEEYEASSNAAFEPFVDHILKRRENSDLVVFRLSLHKAVTVGFLNDCLDYVSRHKVQHLMLRVNCWDRVRLPQILLSSENLVTLSLNSAISDSLQLPTSVTFPKLKTLRLKNFKFSKDNFNGELFTGCPILEALALIKCSIKPRDELKILDVKCLNLKRLVIRYWRSPWICFHEHMINVSAPELEYFSFKGHIARVTFNGGLSCLNGASIDICYPIGCRETDVLPRLLSTLETLLSMLHDIRNVHSFSMTMNTIKILSAPLDGPDLHTTFENLRFLRVTAEDMHGEITRSLGRNTSESLNLYHEFFPIGSMSSTALNCILACSPFVESLTFQLKESSDSE